MRDQLPPFVYVQERERGVERERGRVCECGKLLPSSSLHEICRSSHQGLVYSENEVTSIVEDQPIYI